MHECSLCITVLFYGRYQNRFTYSPRSHLLQTVFVRQRLLQYLRMAKSIRVIVVTRPDPLHFRCFLDSHLILVIYLRLSKH
jgi:hypothetical protein